MPEGRTVLVKHERGWGGGVEGEHTSPGGDHSDERVAVELAELCVELQASWPVVQPQQRVTHAMDEVHLCTS